MGLARFFGRRQRSPNAVVTVDPLMPPYLRPGYQPPQRMSAIDLVTPTAHFPLVWVLDIGGWNEDPTSRQVSFNLTSAYDGRSQTSAAMKMPFNEGDLFDKRGAYVLVALPATDREMVAEIMALAGK
jgi:hypothetical protein